MKNKTHRTVSIFLLTISPFLVSFILSSVVNSLSFGKGLEIGLVAIIGIPLIGIIGVLVSLYNKGTDRESSILGYVVPAALVWLYQIYLLF